MKKVLSIQDISCFGKCSLTAALPIISAMGVETSIIPTAVLSAHTGVTQGYTFRDLTEDINPILKHWGTIPLSFDTVYTGYLGSYAQVDIISSVFTDFAPGALKIVDPVMGDKGELYDGFDDEYAKKIASLCSHADVIVPNITEACAMLDEEYSESYDEGYIEELLFGLRSLGAKNCIITGVAYDDKHIGAALLPQDADSVRYRCTDSVPASYPGTGDVFASTLTGALTLGKDLDESIGIAVDFTYECIRRTVPDRDYKYSVKFEECIPHLLRLCGII